MHAVTYTVVDSSSVAGKLLVVLASLVNSVVTFVQRSSMHAHSNSTPPRRRTLAMERARAKRARAVAAAPPPSRRSSLRESLRLQRIFVRTSYSRALTDVPCINIA
ncbi:hypothetical protein FB45DRAFT_871370 [Roridomyces roridus]|uniref:Uncharacterized protein n=1 Tax=Roridomyces roridus TaxID=1738132 RepID=A0AAD7BGR9_9AGAR|nr:hypothetical protein FB45DRAFT_871370 [Roridomyces roridus]